MVVHLDHDKELNPVARRRGGCLIRCESSRIDCPKIGSDLKVEQTSDPQSISSKFVLTMEVSYNLDLVLGRLAGLHQGHGWDLLTCLALMRWVGLEQVGFGQVTVAAAVCQSSILLVRKSTYRFSAGES